MIDEVIDRTHPAVLELEQVLKHFDISMEGPDAADPVDRQTFIYQTTWVVDYDAITKRVIMAKRHNQVM